MPWCATKDGAKTDRTINRSQGGSSAGRSEVRFVIGYPQNQEQRNQSRAAIQGNSSRIRWRKGTSTVEPARVEPRRRRSTHIERPVRSLPHDCQASTRGHEKRVPVEEASSADDIALTFFDRSLKDLVLPPFLPFEYKDILTKREVWTELQKVHRFWQIIFSKTSDGINGQPSAWMQSAITSSENFQANMMAHFTREYLLSGQTSSRSRRLALEFCAMAIASVQEAMKNPATAISNSIIMAVATLAVHPPPLSEPSPARPVGPRPSQGPLKSLQFIDIYGGPFKPVRAHRTGWLRMIGLRGGVKAMGLREAAFPLTMLEIWTSSRYLHRPALEYFPTITGVDLASSLAMNRRVDHPLRRTGAGFGAVFRLDTSNFAIQVQAALELLALHSLAVDDYVSGWQMRKSLDQLAEERNFVQHRLLSLCPEESKMHGCVDEGVARACHRAGLIYSYLCVFPIPDAPFALLVRQLRQQFKENDFVSQWDQAPELLTWVACMYAIAAIGKAERALAVTMLRRCLQRLMIDTWDDFQQLLSGFLWYPNTNDVDGIELWDEIEQMGLPRLQRQTVEEIE